MEIFQFWFNLNMIITRSNIWLEKKIGKNIFQNLPGRNIKFFSLLEPRKAVTWI